MNWAAFRLTEAVAMIAVLVIVWTMYRAQRDKRFKEFNLFDLLMEHGRLSRIACVFLASFLVTTWIIVRLTLDGKMTENYMTIYGGLWVIPIIAKIYGPQQREPDEPHPTP